MVLETLASAGIGVLIGWSLAAPPGPVNAVIASHAVTRSWHAAFLVGLGASAADAVFLLLSVAGHEAILALQWLFPLVAAVGSGVMAFLAWTAIRAWSRGPVPAGANPRPESRASSFVTGLTVNATSPYPILWWLTVGIVLIDQLGPLVLVGFFAGLLSWTSLFPFLLRAAQRRFARAYHAVLAFSILTLLGFAIWLAWTAFAGLG